MYRGKHARPRSKQRFRISFVFLVSAIVLLLGLAGGTIAYFVASDGPAQNTFTYARVSCRVEEIFSNGTKSDVTVKNTGNTDAYIRAMVIVTWKDEAGNVYGPSQPAEDTDYTITYGSGWTKGTDGYYYFNYAVAPGDNTAVLIGECLKKDGVTPPAGYDLSVEIIADAVQSQSADAVSEAWGYTPAGN